MRWRKHDVSEPAASGQEREDRDGGGVPPTFLRDFFYLDANQAFDALSTLQGGEALESVRKFYVETGREANLGVKWDIPLGPIGLDAGVSGKKAKRLEEEIHFRQTGHSAIGRLLVEVDKRLEEEDCSRETWETKGGRCNS